MDSFQRLSAVCAARGGKLSFRDPLTGQTVTRIVNGSQALAAMTAESAAEGLDTLAGQTVNVSTRIVDKQGRTRSLSQTVIVPETPQAE